MNNDQDKLIELGRKIFTELENLINSHKKSNTLPILGATDIFATSHQLLKVAQELNRQGIEDNPILSVNNPEIANDLDGWTAENSENEIIELIKEWKLEPAMICREKKIVLVQFLNNSGFPQEHYAIFDYFGSMIAGNWEPSIEQAIAKSSAPSLNEWETIS
jgi:hypothetical protein